MMKLTFRVLLPVALIALGVFMLVGCIWLPIREHPADKKQVDFRKYLSGGQLRVGVGRAVVQALLGEPMYTFDQGRLTRYWFDTDEGLRIWPLCFYGYPTIKRAYVLQLTFDDNNTVTSVVTAKREDNGYLDGLVMDPASTVSIHPEIYSNILHPDTPQTQPVPLSGYPTDRQP